VTTKIENVAVIDGDLLIVGIGAVGHLCKIQRGEGTVGIGLGIFVWIEEIAVAMGLIANIYYSSTHPSIWFPCKCLPK